MTFDRVNLFLLLARRKLHPRDDAIFRTMTVNDVRYEVGLRRGAVCEIRDRAVVGVLIVR
jgi:hypothetical protein